MLLEKLLINIYDYAREKIAKKPTFSSADLPLGEAQKLYQRDKSEKLYLTPDKRAKHLYLIGASGSGKTTLIDNFIRDDVLRGRGFCLLEPHGDLSENVSKFLAAFWSRQNNRDKQRISRKTVLIEPFNPEAVVSFNPLEVLENNQVYPNILELVQVFKQRWEDCWGPRMSELLRASLVTLAENKLTLLECPQLLTNTRFRNSLLDNLENEEIKEYFIQRYNKLREADKTKYREPVLNKVLEFLTDKNIRYAIGQTKSALNFRQAMDESKWLILNFSKGRLKSNALLLGGLFLAKLQAASLSRVDLAYEKRTAFTIYLDEFQNFINQEEGGDIETMLSESRKYGLSLVMAHQNLGQVDQKLLGAILGNVSTIIVFRISRKDAMTLAPEINPNEKDKLIDELINLKVGQAYIKVKGEPARLAQLPYQGTFHVDETILRAFKKDNAFYHGLRAGEVEREIQERHRKLGLKPAGAQNRIEVKRNRIQRTEIVTGEEEGQNEW
ncbi:MAG: type IV secretion system DNA-binding domain-containing protein [bacterium]|nr:type IV secretion system DNA-binding domain-containing protein [bacterium]